ncbi:MAG: hypothetical protein K2X93_03115 [Candidatus Obscuribacterales bacterium]|nr:hypothetical protein [Candidatus Obscuribacterales bacterium]
MKKSIFKLSLFTLTATVVGACASQPAMAQGARFAFEPNKWKTQEMNKPGRYLNQQPSGTRVGHGSMPKASSFLGGVSPEFLKPAPKPQPVQPMITTNVQPSASFGQPRIVPKQQPQQLAATPATPFNPNFGNPMQPAPVVAQQPQQMSMPPQVANPTSSRNSLSGRMVPRHSSHGHARSAVAGRLMKPTQPSAMRAVPQVASYGGSHYVPGSTKPVSSGTRSEGNVYGQIVRH